MVQGVAAMINIIPVRSGRSARNAEGKIGAPRPKHAHEKCAIRSRTWRAVVATLLGGALITICCVPLTKGDNEVGAAGSSNGNDKAAPPGMVWIHGGEFTMGTDDVRNFPNERPAHRVHVGGFWIDEHDVTNAEFAKFVEATGYVTTAERKPDWEELKKELPPGTPKPDDSVLVAGSLVFTPTAGPVPLSDLSAWWRWIPGANWSHPEGPGSTIQGRVVRHRAVRQESFRRS